MTIALKQSTASQEIPLGYFLDSTDGDTAETALTINNTDIKLWKNGATSLVNKNSGGATHMAGGVYYCTLDATDTNTVGPLIIFVHVSGALAVRVECHVYEEAIYDALFGSLASGFDANGRVDLGSWLGTAVTTSATSSKPEVDVYSVSDDATAANNIEADYDGTGYNKSNSTIGTCTANTDMRGTDNALLASSAPTNFGDLAITATTGKVTVGTNSDKTGYSISGTKTTLDALNDITAASVWSVATRTITGGTVDTCTTNSDMRGTDNALLASSAPANFGDLAITATTGRVTVGTNNDKTGYSLTQAFPTNFADLSISATTGLVDITQTAADKVWSTTTRALTDKANFTLDLTQTVPANTSTTPNTTGDLLYLIRQGFKNKLDYDKATDTMTLYQDNGTTALFSHSMTDDASNATRGAG